MTTPTETIRAFYTALGKGDAPTALGLMADDIEWTTMWHYKVNGRGPQKVAEEVLVPLTKEWSEFRMDPSEFIAQGDIVVSLGRFVATHRATRKQVDAGYAHVWTVKAGRIVRFRQFIDTRAVADARR